jgi:hypothetical protein
MALRIAFWFLVAVSVVSAEELRFESSDKQTALVELYTSEGCSSCPPAEAWLSKLKSDPRLWKDFVPLAFHVDYWDRLGWRDRFSSRAWTERQNKYAELLHSESVYTPEFVLNGVEWRDWFRNRQTPKAEPKNAGGLSATTSDNKTFSISYRGEGNSRLEAHAALLGCGINSKIGGGENNGRQLQHDFVVLAHGSALMKNSSSSAQADVAIESSGNDIVPKAIAIWISRESQLAPLQATGGWLGKIASTSQSE